MITAKATTEAAPQAIGAGQYDGAPRAQSQPLVFCAALTLFYLAFTPGTIEGMGYNRENLVAVEQLVANLLNLAQGQPLTAQSWTRHGGWELLFELPFALLSRLVFGASLKRLGGVMVLQPILATALLGTLLLLWVRRVAGSWRWGYVLALVAACTTLLWPYAYIGLETTQSLCLLAAGYLVLGRTPRHTWPEVLALTFCCASALSVKLNGAFLLPALGYLLYRYFRAADAKRYGAQMATVALTIIAVYILNYRLKAHWWATIGIGSTSYFREMLVADPLVALFQAFSYFGAANKSLLIYAPVTALCLWQLPRAYRLHSELVIFTLLALGGLIGGFALVQVWTEETWGPRYLHSAIAPLVVCLAASRAGAAFSWRREKLLLATGLLGAAVSLLGVLFFYGQMHTAATNAGHATLEALQYDPRWNHIRFNWQLLQTWARQRWGQGEQPQPWPPPPHWWFERPADTPPEKTVDLRTYALLQPLALRARPPTISYGTFSMLRLGGLLALAFSAGLVVWLLRWPPTAERASRDRGGYD